MSQDDPAEIAALLAAAEAAVDHFEAVVTNLAAGYFVYVRPTVVPEVVGCFPVREAG